MKVKKELIAKYNKPLPRYTSYPPANKFADGFTDETFRQMLEFSNLQEPQHVSIYVHIPFCERICFYCGCNTMPMTGTAVVEKYVNALLSEIDLISPYIFSNRKISQIHFGGGTPNAISVDFIRKIVEHVKAKFSFIENPEIAIECHPGILEMDYLKELLNIEFNRFSFGIQDFDADVLKKVNRKASLLPIEELIAEVRKYNASNTVNLDFIYGLPNQTIESFTEVMQKAASLKPDRLVTFSYAHVPWVKEHQKVLDKYGLPDAENKLAMFLSSYEIMKQSGYTPIGLDHYALPSDELSMAHANKSLSRNFQGYCTKRTTGQVYAFGTSSISQLAGGYAQNTKDIFTYISEIKNRKLPVEKGYKLSETDKLIKEVITHVMCNLSLNWKELSLRFKLPTKELKEILHFNEGEFQMFQQDKLLSITKEGFEVSELGSLFIRNIATALDPAFDATKNQYSKSV
jgi:oxygen-independent coproporphyrinogen-3 oxidase